ADAPLRMGCDLGIHAAQIVRQALYGRGTPEQGLAEANAVLYAEQDATRSAYAEATCVVADVDGERVTIVQAGDCDAWTFEAGSWRRVFPEGAMAGEAAERDREWYRENAGPEITELL